jgi:hypothetical protein
LESCSTTAITAELNFDRTEGMRRVDVMRRGGELVDDELADEVSESECSTTGSSGSVTEETEEAEGFAVRERVATGAYAEGRRRDSLTDICGVLIRNSSQC